MPTASTSLLGLALPVQGELSGTWGDTVNNSITSLVDSAIAGTTTISSTTNPYILTTTALTSNEARQAIILCTGARIAIQTIVAPLLSKIYVVINATTGGFAVKIAGVGPTTGVTVPSGKTVTVVWNGSDFVAAGGTTINLATDVTGTLPIANGGSGQATQQAALNALVGTQTANRVLRSDGTNSTLAQVALATDVTGTLPIANGGSGQTTQQTALNALVGTQTANRVLRSDGTNSTLAQVALATDVSGTLPVANGGTGQTTFTDGQLLIGNTTGNTLSKATLTAGANITITNGSGAITIAATGSGGGVTSVTGTSPIVSSGGATPAISLTTVPVNLGGTNLTSYTLNGILYASGTGTLATSTSLTFNGNSVGIGATAGAFYPLDVQVTTTFTNIYLASFKNSSTSTTEGALIRVTQNASGAAEGFFGTFGSGYSGSTWANTFGVSTIGNNPLALGTGNTVRVHIDTSGNAQMRTGAVMPYAPAPATISTTATLTNADIQAQIINTTGTTYTVTMPLGTTLEAITTWVSSSIGYDFTVINTASGTITIAANTGVTTLGALTIATGESAQFRIRRTTASTFVLYRLS